MTAPFQPLTFRHFSPTICMSETQSTPKMRRMPPEGPGCEGVFFGSYSWSFRLCGRIRGLPGPFGRFFGSKIGLFGTRVRVLVAPRGSPCGREERAAASRALMRGGVFRVAKAGRTLRATLRTRGVPHCAHYVHAHTVHTAATSGPRHRRRRTVAPSAQDASATAAAPSAVELLSPSWLCAC